MKRKGQVIGFIIMIIVCCVCLKSNSTNNYHHNKILQINLDKIYSSIETACADLTDSEKEFKTVADNLVDDCYISVKTICALGEDKYDLKEFRGFLLDLSSVDAYTPEQKEQITESLDAIHQAFESISWRSTKGLGAGVTGEYDFLLNDYKEVNKIVTEMNHAEIQIAAD